MSETHLHSPQEYFSLYLELIIIIDDNNNCDLKLDFEYTTCVYQNAREHQTWICERTQAAEFCTPKLWRDVTLKVPTQHVSVAALALFNYFAPFSSLHFTHSQGLDCVLGFSWSVGISEPPWNLLLFPGWGSHCPHVLTDSLSTCPGWE